METIIENLEWAGLGAVGAAVWGVSFMVLFCALNYPALYLLEVIPTTTKPWMLLRGLVCVFEFFWAWVSLYLIYYLVGLLMQHL